MQVVQLETIDACNAKCYKCPYKDVYHTKKIMSDEVFLKIIDEVGRLVKDDYIRICFYLNNEPLLDPLLFKRVQFVRKLFPTIETEISTNCLLLPKYFDQVVEHFDVIILALQGWDTKSYNLIHRLNITDQHYDKMRHCYEEIKKLENSKKITAKCWDPKLVKTDLEDVDSWYTMRYSKAGFFRRNKILIREMDGCEKDKHKILNFLHDGTIVLCCMDCIRESVLGNIKHQSLQDILNSKLYKTVMQKVEGKLKSESDFICKRCELALGVKNESVSDSRERVEISKR